MKLTGNESLHFLFLKSISCRVYLWEYLFKISDQLEDKWLKNGWDIVDSNLEKTGNEIESNRKWTITFPVFEVNIL